MRPFASQRDANICKLSFKNNLGICCVVWNLIRNFLNDTLFTKYLLCIPELLHVHASKCKCYLFADKEVHFSILFSKINLYVQLDQQMGSVLFSSNLLISLICLKQ